MKKLIFTLSMFLSAVCLKANNNSQSISSKARYESIPELVACTVFEVECQLCPISTLLKICSFATGEQIQELGEQLCANLCTEAPCDPNGPIPTNP
jgi:hypothetical protein